MGEFFQTMFCCKKRVKDGKGFRLWNPQVDRFPVSCYPTLAFGTIPTAALRGMEPIIPDKPASATAK